MAQAKKVTKGRTCLMVAVCFGVATLAVLLLLPPGPHFPANVDLIKAEFSDFPDWVETERERTGSYPERIPERFYDRARKFGVEVLYGRTEDGQRCGICFGDYVLNGAVLHWNSEGRRWTVDN